MEGGGRIRRCNQIVIGDHNAFTQGCWLWPDDTDFAGVRIRIGNSNFFNRNVMIDSCGSIDIGDQNMIGPDVYMTDSNHQFGHGLAACEQPMDRGNVVIGNRCWIGAKAVILKGARLGDCCVVGAGAVVNSVVEPGQVVAGVPARPITSRSSPNRQGDMRAALRSEHPDAFVREFFFHRSRLVRRAERQVGFRGDACPEDRWCTQSTGSLCV